MVSNLIGQSTVCNGRGGVREGEKLDWNLS